MNPSGSVAKSETTGTLAARAVLIAGCGYVGQRAAQLWAADGIRTFAVTRATARAEHFQAQGIQPLVFDLAAANSWPDLPDADVVLWSVGFDRSPGSNRQATWVDGLQRLLAALPARKNPRRILYTSSTGVYGDGAGQDVDEFTPVNPNTEGGAACVAAEEILHGHAKQTGNEVVILRLAGIYGPDRLLRRVDELRKGTPLTSEPEDWLNLIHVDDAVRMINWCGRPESWSVLNSLKARFADLRPVESQSSVVTINVVSSHSVTRRMYYSELARQTAAPEPVFGSSPDATTISGSHRGRSGNRRVVSRLRESLPVKFQFDDCSKGLADAVTRSHWPS